MNYIKILLIGTLILLSGCTITHTYGPYEGNVVDKDTGEPIEGAVVFIKFSVDGLGGASAFVDAVEVMTNEKGEFNIPARRVYFVRPLYDTWEPGHIIIFKPGYGVYPRHRESEPLFIPNYSIPENKDVIIKLPKLETRKERVMNAGNALSFNRSEVPYENYKLIFEAVNQEYRLIGSEPLPDPRKFKWSK